MSEENLEENKIENEEKEEMEGSRIYFVTAFVCMRSGGNLLCRKDP